jgi:hypothetical protein
VRLWTIPDDLAEVGYSPCPVCVIDAGDTFVEWEGLHMMREED